MDEFVIVMYPRRRGVEISGVKRAMTREPFIVGTGTYTFSLTGPDNYMPPKVVQTVEDTSPQDPLVITFTPKATIRGLVGNGANIVKVEA